MYTRIIHSTCTDILTTLLLYITIYTMYTVHCTVYTIYIKTLYIYIYSICTLKTLTHTHTHTYEGARPDHEAAADQVHGDQRIHQGGHRTVADHYDREYHVTAVTAGSNGIRHRVSTSGIGIGIMYHLYKLYINIYRLDIDIDIDIDYI